MILEFLYLALGLLGLYFGAEWLVGGSTKLALRFGVAPLVIGLTVVAFGTSAPELAVSLQLNYAGNPDAAVGNVVGSNICNILLILGISALIMPLAIKSQVVRREMPILILVSLILVWVLHDNHISRLEGVGMFVGILVYVWLSFALANRGSAPEVEEEFAAEFGDSKDAEPTPGIVLAALIVVGIGLLVVGSAFFKAGGVGLAERLGVSPAVIGLTLLAFGTSLPELATSVVACLKNEGDIIAGNAVGSSVFNVLAILGVTASLKPMDVTGIQPLDLGVMVGAAVVGAGLMATRMKLERWEGAAMLAAYVFYIGLLVTRG